MKLTSHSCLGAIVKCKNGIELCYNFKSQEKELAPLFSGPAWSSMIWEASLILCDFLEKNVDVNNCNVLELGAGCGLPGIHATLSGANMTVLTDLEQEIDVTRIIEEDLSEYNIQLQVLEWDRKNAIDFKQMIGHDFDVILASDCVSTDVYGRASWLSLCDTIDELLAPGGRLYICSVRRPKDGLEEFLHLLHNILPIVQLVETRENTEIYECKRT